MSIEDRLRRVEDELAIQRVLIDYAAHLDARDWDAYADLFADDGSWTNAEGSYHGQQAIRDMLAAYGPGKTRNATSFHLISNPRIEIDGDRATSFCRYLFVLRGEDARATPQLAGTYHDRFVRVDGAWKIASRTVEEVFPTHAEWDAMFLSKFRK